MVAVATAGSDPVPRVSVLQRGIGAPGDKVQRPTEERGPRTRAGLEDRMAVLRGGLAVPRAKG